MKRVAISRSAGRPHIVAVTARTTETSYSQEELLDLFQIKDRRARSIFLNSHIAQRYLILPPENSEGKRIETQGELLRKHRTVGVDLGVRAVRAILEQANATISDVRYVCCISSTGLLTPGFSALLCHEMNVPRDCTRLDVVGMGCNAGLNGLNAVAAWTEANPGELAVMVCIEVCSAAYVFDGTLRSIVVNSLFGDGAAAVALRSHLDGADHGAALLKFASCLIPDTLEAMRYDWDDVHGKFSFFIDPQVPYIVGAHAEEVVDRLLSNTNLRRKDIDHWVVHGGGKKVIDAIMVNLGLSRHDVRHTLDVLRDYGNLSSGSFLFSYKRLLDEGTVKAGDYGVLMSMGPGSTIETALVQW
jgi:3,5-dihydroxyphenylacetyl-CoA synthase